MSDFNFQLKCHVLMMECKSRILRLFYSEMHTYRPIKIIFKSYSFQISLNPNFSLKSVLKNPRFISEVNGVTQKCIVE